MKRLRIDTLLKSNSYPGRGIIIGKSQNGLFAVIVYFIMGRSENSRNRIFVTAGDGIRTTAFDEKKLKDPSLIIYSPIKTLGNKTIVTNGDHTDTICTLMSDGYTFEQALSTREFEPDAPSFTPRISGIVEIADGKMNYSLSILKSCAIGTDGNADGNPESCQRFSFSYGEPPKGYGSFIHTYKCDGNPLPSFEGEPLTIEIPDDIDTFSDLIWRSLNEQNKISLFVRYIRLDNQKAETRIINKNI